MEEKQIEKRKILIVEDDVFFRELLLKKFQKENFDVFIAKDGKEGFAYLESNSPDIIVLDLILPDLNGYEILSMLKREKKTKGVPVVVLSNLGQQEEMEKAMALGAADFLIKVNFTLEEIVEKIKQVLGRTYI